ncbi:MAG: hypothetical protein ABL962_11865, partial [Fimbriimonadaceae bacterium]
MARHEREGTPLASEGANAARRAQHERRGTERARASRPIADQRSEGAVDNSELRNVPLLAFAGGAVFLEPFVIA